MNSSSEISIPKVSFMEYFLIGLLMIAGMWAWWGIEQKTDYRIGRRSSTRQEPISIMYPAISVPIILIGSLIWWRRSAGITKHGVIVQANIDKLGMAKSGLQNVSLSYIVNSTIYAKRLSVNSIVIADKNPGDELTIVADQRNPERIIVLDEQPDDS